MKRAFGSRRGYCALRFMAAKPPLHRSRKAFASYSRSECFIDKHLVLWYNYLKGGDIMANDKLTEQSLDFDMHPKS